ncbi:MAG: M48 family metallopeptidase [Campylobacteraceae bacterium]|jgi:Zn-dependent protease with chaperone function|nr:M48 family metallopeptidase [Campylobacteraceae bacterium]
MNFFEQQKRAERKSKFLTLLFLLGTLGVCAAVCYVAGVIILYASRDYGGGLSPSDILKAAQPEFLLTFFFGTLMLIVLGSLHKIFQLSRDSGKTIASSLGGRRLSKNNASANELTLLNIVDEMSIASGIPSPTVYLLDQDDSINAFAAGTTYDDAVIGVTKGSIDFLTRSELQGVIAHEFSHIFNGDMKLNIRSIGVLNGILLISLIGEIIIRSLSKSRNKKGGGAALAIGLALYLIGYIGLFFGSLIKAAINRQREYLADASAAQFTRYPKGLADALKKIGGASSLISSANADEFSHLYFSSGVKNFFSFSTHPPLKNRIKTLEPHWDGNYISPKRVLYTKEAIQKPAKEKVMKTITIAAVLNEINNIGSITSDKLETANKKIDSIPKLLRENSIDAFSAQFIIFAILLDKNEKIRKIQTDIVTQNFFAPNNESLKRDFDAVVSQILNLARDMYLTLIQISMSALKTLSKEQYLKFKTVINQLIEADRNISWFELNLKYLVLYPLDIAFGIRKIPQEIYSHIAAVKFDAEVMLSAITHAQFADDKQANEAFEKIAKIFDINIKYIPSENISFVLLENAYEQIQKAKPLLRKKVLEMAIMCLKTDDEKLSQQDIETIHALCALLHLPISV